MPGSDQPPGSGLPYRASWSTPAAAAAALVIGGVALLLCGWLTALDPVGRFLLTVAGIAAIGAGAIGGLLRPRLAITDEPSPHLVVRTLTGSREYAVEQVEVVKLLGLQHIGRRSRQLSLDLLAPDVPPAGAGGSLREDTRLVTFGRWSLGEDPAVVFEEIEAAGFRVDR